LNLTPPDESEALAYTFLKHAIDANKNTASHVSLFQYDANLPVLLWEIWHESGETTK
jgi:hypothetical protein